MKHRLLLFFLWICGWAHAAQFDAVRISMLTCTAGPEVYALYGHTAIRVEYSETGQDWVFNYGTFNMSDPWFIPKFTLGWMDYELGLLPYKPFYAHYTQDGCDIIQQELNLTAREKVKLLELLENNYQPENRGYRYNFLYDNCSTRPRDILESVVEGKLVWPADTKQVSYRQLMHQCNDIWPWSKLGIDLCLGSDADRPITPREQEFLPAYLMRHLAQAVVVDSAGHERPLVLHEQTFNRQSELDMRPEFFLLPIQCCLLLIGMVGMVCVLEWRRKKLYWQVDVSLYAAQGLAGVLVFILFFFSVHPTVDSNWQLWIFNPLPILYLPVMIYRRRHGLPDQYAVLKALSLGLFILSFTFIPQDMPIETFLVALVLLVRACQQLYLDGLILKTRQK